MKIYIVVSERERENGRNIIKMFILVSTKQEY
jgi:hypothetical protein